ncbi:hypothetical protein FACS1894168_3100 [Deltaproteobacteria bacterium]|nr:hypothetical protein FACS1894168_3100 [Deltaproteobacteria bacterium]
MLGSMFEVNLRRTLVDTDGSILPFFTHPVPALFLVLGVLSVAYSIWQKNRKKA